MPTQAGMMSNAAQPNAQWVAADGAPYYTMDPKQPRRTALATGGGSRGDRRDYVLRNGAWGRRRGLGINGWIVCVPISAGYKVALADDNGEAALVANVTTTTTASVAAGQTVIPVTAATGFVVGLPIAATGIPAGASIAAINGLNITINPATTGTVASGATVTVTPPGPPTVAKPPAGTR